MFSMIKIKLFTTRSAYYFGQPGQDFWLDTLLLSLYFGVICSIILERRQTVYLCDGCSSSVFSTSKSVFLQLISLKFYSSYKTVMDKQLGGGKTFCSVALK